MKKTLISIVLLLFLVSFSFAQVKEEEKETSLYDATIRVDIETSNFHELTDWCSRLGLPKEGSAKELRRRLYNYYEVKAETDSNDKKSAQRITIEKADNLDYFTIEKVDENYAKISGDVYLKLFDDEKNETHVIRADTILFNFKENYITATGNIEYKLEGETKIENFRGEKLTFNIDNSEGLFDKGITEQQKTVAEEEIVFYFKGDLINKTRENFVVLEDGQITSCDFDDPHYTIKAKKIWLLTSNEWAILNGILYIGRVPVFYFPAFLYGSDDIFFNPVFGVKSDYGNYLQTTTYLIGEKEKDEDTSFSFMQSAQENNYYKFNGLYLTQDDNPPIKTRALQDYGRGSKNYVKFLLDYYTNLGLYAAIDLKLGKPNGEEEKAFPDFINSLFSIFSKTELYLSAAKTRYIENTGSFYSALFYDDTGEYSSIWLDSFFINNRIPLRYGLDFESSIDISWMKLNLGWTMFSDPGYTSDFNNRTENLDLFSFLESDGTSETGAIETNSYNWFADMVISPEIMSVSPFIKNLSMNAKTQLGWNSKNIDSLSKEYDDTVDEFFYPDSFEKLISSLSIGGQILPFDMKNKNQTESVEDEEKIELLPPWEDFIISETIDSDLDSQFESAPDIAIDISNYWADNSIFSNKLSYSLTPKYSNRSQFSSDEWETPDDIKFTDIYYSYQNTSLSGKINYNANVFGNFFGIDNSTSVNWDQVKHYNMDSLNELTKENYLDEDKQASDAKVANNLSISVMPLVYLDLFEKSKITYSFNNTIYEWDYSIEENAYRSDFFDFEEDFVSNHNIKLALNLDFKDIIQEFVISTTLPPVTLKTSGSYKLVYGISTSEIKTDFSENEDDYDFSPLTYNQKLDFKNNGNFTNSLSYNYSELYFEKNISNINLSFYDGNLTSGSSFTYDFTTNIIDSLKFGLGIYFLSSEFTAKNTYDYNLDQDLGWIPTLETAFIPDSWTFTAAQKSEPIIFWKNRVNLKFDIDSTLKMNLIQFTESNYSLKLGFELKIFKFLDLIFESTSVNKAIYRYIPSYCEEVGVSSIDLFSDLIKSFNFFNVEDRYESNFNLNRIKFGLKHEMHDWDLNITYAGKPYVNEEGDFPFYDWETELDISLKWRAIPDVKSEVEIDKDGVSF